VGEPRAKVFEYAIEVDADGAIAIPHGTRIEPPADWTADHLLLAALVRCTLHSFAYHARKAGHEVLRSSGAASGHVTKRERDDRWAFIEIDCRIEAELSPPAAEPGELIANAERDCFVAASLTVEPRYEWRVG
jgi:organic hydroperoxide reductase OsmC/OhrA